VSGPAASGDSRDVIEVVVEIPSGSRNKYEYDHERHRFVLDRVLYSSVHYPCDYGFIAGSMAEDGDPLDVLVVIAEPTFPGCVVRARPIGVLDMADEKGHDYKILAVAHDDPRWEEAAKLEDVSPHRLREIENFFETYKTLERRPTDVRGWLGVEDAWRIIGDALDAGRSPDPSAGRVPGIWR
jgi:inorganic pyrophosphatase